MTTLAQQHDCLLLDLDGTLFRGHKPTPGAVETLGRIEAQTLFVTNNASRSAVEVAAHLCELGFDATADEVVTSAQSAAKMLADRLPGGSKVLVVGTDSLAGEVAAVGLRPVRLFAEEPVAVVQGLSMTTCWQDLAEAALAIRSGALWVTANLDVTLPTERGLIPGNGSVVAALRAATDCEPLVAGKPFPPLMRDALARGRFATPLAVGDRLDTDIAGANAAGLPSLLVLSGVSTAADAVGAEPALRPSYIGSDLRALLQDPRELAVGQHPAWRIVVSGSVAVFSTGADPGPEELSVVRAVADATWQIGHQVPVLAGDDTARAALQRWSLLSQGDRLA